MSDELPLDFESELPLDFESELPLDLESELSLAEMVNRVLDRGAVISGEVVIGVAGVDLVYLGVQLVVAAVESARQHGGIMLSSSLPSIAARPGGREPAPNAASSSDAADASGGSEQ